MVYFPHYFLNLFFHLREFILVKIELYFFLHWKGAKPKKNYIEIMRGVGTPEESKEHNWSTPNGGTSNKVNTSCWQPRVAKAFATRFAYRYTCRILIFHPSWNKLRMRRTKLLPPLLPSLSPPRVLTTVIESIWSSMLLSPFCYARHNPLYTHHSSALKADACDAYIFGNFVIQFPRLSRKTPPHPAIPFCIAPSVFKLIQSPLGTSHLTLTVDKTL
jgi:hypothetical protein